MCGCLRFVLVFVWFSCCENAHDSQRPMPIDLYIDTGRHQQPWFAALTEWSIRCMSCERTRLTRFLLLFMGCAKPRQQLNLSQFWSIPASLWPRFYRRFVAPQMLCFDPHTHARSIVYLTADVSYDVDDKSVCKHTCERASDRCKSMHVSSYNMHYQIG